MCSPEKTLLVWRVMKFVFPVVGEPRRRIVRFFGGVVWGGVMVDDIAFLHFAFLLFGIGRSGVARWWIRWVVVRMLSLLVLA